jgi:hypothetical protein
MGCVAIAEGRERPKDDVLSAFVGSRVTAARQMRRRAMPSSDCFARGASLSRPGLCEALICEVQIAGEDNGAANKFRLVDGLESPLRG